MNLKIETLKGLKIFRVIFFKQKCIVYLYFQIKYEKCDRIRNDWS